MRTSCDVPMGGDSERDHARSRSTASRARSTASPRTPPRSTACAASGSPAPRRAAPRASAAPAAVMVARPDDGAGSRWTPVNACLVPAARARRPGGRHRRGARHPRPICTRCSASSPTRGGSQCGYCTPGFVCSMAAEYYRRRRAAATAPSGPNGFDLHALERQPLPLHRLPARSATPPTPSRARAPPTPCADAGAARRPRPCRPGVARRSASSSGPPTSPRRSTLLRRAPRRRRWSPGRPTGAWRSTCAVAARRYVVAVDRLAELRECVSTDDRSRSAPR